ncbi:MAG: methyltransferase domain-containing protein [Vicinamibacterales bacterium]
MQAVLAGTFFVSGDSPPGPATTLIGRREVPASDRMGLLNAARFLLTGHPLRAGRQLRMWTRLRWPRAPLKLHLGCGRRRMEGFVNIDHAFNYALDYVGDITKLPCPDHSVSRIESYHVIEHIGHQQVPALIRDWRRMLVPGGSVVVECPDFDRDVLEYQQGNLDRLYSVFGRQRFPGDAHFFGYNRARLEALFEDAGYTAIVCTEGTDYHSESEPCLRLECRTPELAGRK